MNTVFLKKVCATLISVTVLSTSVFAMEKEKGFQNFQEKYNFTDETFTDIEAQWVLNAVKPAYELGLLSGREAGKFYPNSQFTLAEALSVASRINSIYFGKGDEIKPSEDKEYENWYDIYVDYAIENGIIEKDTFDDYTRNAKRGEVAYIFAKSLPDECFDRKNTVINIPDVRSETEYSDSIYKLYEAGILSGKDEYGTFYADDNITREEAAVIISHIAMPDTRYNFNLKYKWLENQNYASKKMIISSDGIFSLIVPAKWNMESTFTYPEYNMEIYSENGILRIDSQFVPYSKYENSEKYIEDYKNEINGIYNNIDIFENQNFNINNEKVVRFDVTGYVQNIDIYTWNFVFETTGGINHIQVSCPYSKAKGYVDEVFDIINTLQTR